MDLYDEIAKVAYELFEREGCMHGRHFEHWIQAEVIVKSRYEQQQEKAEEKDGEALKTDKKAKTKPAAKKPAVKKPAAKKTPGKKTPAKA